MYGDEFSKIKAAVDHYASANAVKADLQTKRQSLAQHRNGGAKIQIGFVGNSDRIDVPEKIAGLLYEWLDRQMAIEQDELSRFQVALTCPAGTNDR